MFANISAACLLVLFAIQAVRCIAYKLNGNADIDRRLDSLK